MADRQGQASEDTLDDLLINGLQVFQARQGYRFSVDAVLLAHFPELEHTDKIIDIGTGSGVIPLLLSQRCQAGITGVEIQTDMAARALKSVKHNHLEDRIHIIQADINDIDQILPGACADLIVSNPPYWKAGEGKISSRPEEAIARHELKLTLEQLIRQSAYLLTTGGRLALIQRADRLQEAMSLLSVYQFAARRLRMVHSNHQTEARMILLEAVKGSHPSLKILPSLYLYQEDGSYTPEIEAIYYGHQKRS